MAVDLDTFAPIEVPHDRDGLQLMATTLQTWLTRLRAMNVKTYEEGEWIPLDQSGANLVLTTPAVNKNQYVKVGRLVTVAGSVKYPATGDTSQAILGGLPFLVDQSNYGMTIGYQDAGIYGFLVAAGTKVFAPVSITGAIFTNANLSGKTIYFSATYRASA